MFLCCALCTNKLINSFQLTYNPCYRCCFLHYSAMFKSGKQQCFSLLFLIIFLNVANVWPILCPFSCSVMVLFASEDGFSFLFRFCSCTQFAEHLLNQVHRIPQKWIPWVRGIAISSKLYCLLVVILLLSRLNLKWVTHIHPPLFSLCIAWEIFLNGSVELDDEAVGNFLWPLLAGGF